MGNGQGKPVDLDGEGELALRLAQSCHPPNHHEPTTPLVPTCAPRGSKRHAQPNVEPFAAEMLTIYRLNS